jgi:hypothetical protein
MFRIPVETLAYWQRREADIGAPDAAALATVVGLANGKLPQDYIDFVKTYAFPLWEFSIPDSFDARFEHDGQTVVSEKAISHLWSDRALLEMTPNIWRDEPQNGLPMLPQNMFPVGGDPGQDLILVEMEPNCGRIWYWEYSTDAFGTGSNKILGLVADTFTDFINNLRMGSDA